MTFVFFLVFFSFSKKSYFYICPILSQFPGVTLNSASYNSGIHVTVTIPSPHLKLNNRRNILPKPPIPHAPQFTPRPGHVQLTHNYTWGQTNKIFCFRWSDRVTKKGATGDVFSPFFLQKKKKNCFLQKWTIFSDPPKKVGKKKIAAARLPTIRATRWTGNILFVCTGQPGYSG